MDLEWHRFKVILYRGYTVTTEMVNQWRDEWGLGHFVIGGRKFPLRFTDNFILLAIALIGRLSLGIGFNG